MCSRVSPGKLEIGFLVLGWSREGLVVGRHQGGQDPVRELLYSVFVLCVECWKGPQEAKHRVSREGNVNLSAKKFHSGSAPHG